MKKTAPFTGVTKNLSWLIKPSTADVCRVSQFSLNTATAQMYAHSNDASMQTGARVREQL